MIVQMHVYKYYLETVVLLQLSPPMRVPHGVIDEQENLVLSVRNVF